MKNDLNLNVVWIGYTDMNNSDLGHFQLSSTKPTKVVENKTISWEAADTYRADTI